MVYSLGGGEGKRIVPENIGDLFTLIMNDWGQTSYGD
jgi:hypothetical protein